MRKILIGLLIILLAGLLVKTVMSGFPLATDSFSIQGIETIKIASEELDSKMKKIEELTSITYPIKKNTDLASSIRALELEKQRYQEKTEYISEEDVAKANTLETYDSAYLWTILGNYATKHGIVGKFDFVANATGTTDFYDIKFTLTGSYIGITDFLYDIENDQTLNYRIEEFAVVPSEAAAETLQATFTVKNIGIAL